MNALLSIVQFILILAYTSALITLLLNVRLGDVSRRRTVSAFVLLGFILIVNPFVILTHSTGLFFKLYPLLVQVPCFFAFILLSRYKGLRVLFIFFTATVFSDPPLFAANLAAATFQCDAWALVAVLWFCYLIMTVLMRRFFKPLFNYMLEYCNEGWGECCLVSFSLCGISLLGYFDGPHQGPISFYEGIFCVLIFAAYLLILTLFKRTREQIAAQRESEYFHLISNTASEQLRDLKRMQDQAVIYRHDMRHHFALLNRYADDNNIEKLKAYLSAVGSEIDAITPARRCDNETVNLILSAFDVRAKKEGVLLQTDVSLPAELSIDDPELCSLLSNALENAITAAAQLADKDLRKVHIRALVNGDKLVISTQNAYAGEIEMVGGLPRSKQKGNGHGFGVKSIAAIAERHSGLYSFETGDGMFIMRLLLPLHARQ